MNKKQALDNAEEIMAWKPKTSQFPWFGVTLIIGFTAALLFAMYGDSQALSNGYIH